MSDSKTHLRLVAALFTTAVLLAGCSGGGDSGAAKTTTTAGSGGDKTTTTAGSGADKTTTTAADSGNPNDLQASDLEALLPPASKLGAGWTEVATQPDDGSGAAIIKEQCPDAYAAQKNPDKVNKPEAVRTFRDAQGRELEVSFNLDSDTYTDKELQTYVDAVVACKIESGGSSIEFKAQADTEHGEQALQLVQTSSTTVDGVASPVVQNRYSQIFRYGTIGVEIDGSDGVDETTYKVSAFDTDLIDSLTTTIDGALSEIAKAN